MSLLKPIKPQSIGLQPNVCCANLSIQVYNKFTLPTVLPLMSPLSPIHASVVPQFGHLNPRIPAPCLKRFSLLCDVWPLNPQSKQCRPSFPVFVHVPSWSFSTGPLHEQQIDIAFFLSSVFLAKTFGVFTFLPAHRYG